MVFCQEKYFSPRKSMHDDTQHSTFGNELMMLYGRINVSQGEFARLVGVSSVALRKWESGESCPKAESLKRVIERLLSKGAFSKGGELSEAMHLWELANKRGLKVPFDEVWFREVMHSQAGASPGAVGEDSVATDGFALELVEKEPCGKESAREEDDGTNLSSTHLSEIDKRKGFFNRFLAPGKMGGRSKGLLRILIVLVILLIISSAGALFLYARDHATTQANKATRVQASKTAIAQYPGYLSGKGTLAFFDPLSREEGSKWSTDNTQVFDLSCRFTGGAYHVSQQPDGYFAWCPAPDRVSNFAFEVQLTIVQGDCGGIIFRIENPEHLYFFAICQDGHHDVEKFAGPNSSDRQLLYVNTSSVVHRGLGRQNKIAVVASGSTMTYYVNEQQIDQEQDSSYTSGKIALIANPYPGGGHATEVVYSNARLWIL
jgi:DNA-binding XRE family transcriptional regulator